MSISSTKNNVADWLPKEYEETQDLAEFRKYFVGDQFVVVSGPWCRAGNQTFMNFTRKLREESLEHEEVLRQNRNEEEIRAHETGDELGLLYTGDFHETWGEQRERWLMGSAGQWYYINRMGELFRWDGQDNVIGGIKLELEKMQNGRNKAIGTYVDTFGEPPDDARGIENEFYADPEKLCARPFKSISTGPDIFEKMAGKDGTRRIGLFDEEDATYFDTMVKSHQLLTGSLFGPTPEPSFSWTFESLLQHVDDQTRVQLQSNERYRGVFKKYIEYELDNRFDGSFADLRSSDIDTKLELWYRMWEALELEPPPRQTCIIVTINDPLVSELDRVVGRPLLGKARGRILEIATGECGIATENLHIGGPPADNVAIDEEGTITLLRLVNLSMLIGFILAYASFRSIRVTIMLFFVGCVSAIASLAYVWFGGSTLDAILMSMPSLVYVLGLSGAVHVVNYYRDACQESGPKTAAEVALRHGLFPCSLAAFTTAIGLISLYTSNLVPIQKFGLYSAIAVLATVILLFTYLPAALTIWPPGFQRREGDEPTQPSKLTEFVTNTWMAIGEWVIRNNKLVVTSTLLIMAFFAYGIFQVRTSVHLLKLFDSDAKILQDYRWLEDNLGKLVPMELVLCINEDAQQEQYLEKQRALQQLQDNESGTSGPVAGTNESGDASKPYYDEMAYDLKYSMLERMEISHRLRVHVGRVFGPTSLDVVGAGMSTDVFVPIEELDQLDPGKSIEDSLGSVRKLFEQQLRDRRDDMLKEDYLAVIGRSARDPLEALADNSNPAKAGREMWRISLQLAALNDVDYGEFVTNLKVVVEPIMKAYEYRTTILKSLQSTLKEEALIRGRILVLGPKPDPAAYESSLEQMSMEDMVDTVDQTYIFSSTLRDLLENRGYSKLPPAKRPYREKMYSWGDPEVIAGLDKTAESFAKDIEKFDCVVLIEDAPMFDVDLIKQHANSFIDCREHKFLVNSETNIPITGQRTAMQRIKAKDDLEIGTIYTGIIPIVYKAQNQLLKSLINSIALAFVLIAFVMMLLLRNWREPIAGGNALNLRGGLISMLPNVFPIIIVFGAMGHLDIAVDIGSMMTASVAMGVAVDDTIHFLNRYRKGLATGQSRLDSIRLAYRRVATAMTQTTLIGGLGLSAFALSTFTPTQRFGVLMLFMLVAALIGDLIFLPAILASPLGKLFGKERPKSEGETAATVAASESEGMRVVGDFDESVASDGSNNDDDPSTRLLPDDNLPDVHPDSFDFKRKQSGGG